MVFLHRVLPVCHFILLGVALGLNQFSDPSELGSTSEAIAGNIGSWVAQVVAWLTPAYLLAANAGNAGFTRALKALICVYFFIVEIAIFLTFWVGYSSVLFNPAVSKTWQATQIAALVFITMDFVLVLVLAVLTLCTETATVLDRRRNCSGVATVAFLLQLVCLGVILGIYYIWVGILEHVVPGLSTTAAPTTLTTTTTALTTTSVMGNITTTVFNGTTTLLTTTTTATTTLMPTTTPATLPEMIVTNVGLFISFGLWTYPGIILVLRSRENGMLSQDIMWSIFTIIVQAFNLIMSVFVELGSKARLYTTAAVAVSLGAIYFLDLILLFVLTWTQKSREPDWDVNDGLYGRI